MALSRGFAERARRMVGAMTSDVSHDTQRHPLSVMTAMARSASTRAVRGARITFTVEERFEPARQSEDQPSNAGRIDQLKDWTLHSDDSRYARWPWRDRSGLSVTENVLRSHRRAGVELVRDDERSR